MNLPPISESAQRRKKISAENLRLLGEARRSTPEAIEVERVRQRAKRARWRKANRARDLELKRRYRAEKPEVVRAYKATWQAEHPGRHAAYQHSRRASAVGKLSAGIGGRLLVLQRGKCACCRTSLDKSKYHIDHVMPLAKGGLNVDENIQLLCPPCNQAKHAKHPVDFMQSRGFLL